MENKKNDYRIGTPKKDILKWFYDLLTKEDKLKKERLRALKKTEESTIQTQDRRNLYPRGGTNMWTYKENKTVKRDIEFATLVYSYKETAYSICINNVISSYDDISKCNEAYTIPLNNTYGDILVDTLPDVIEYGDDLYIFLNISKKKAASMLNGKYKDLDDDKYISILKYLNENIFTSWIFDTPNILKQLEDTKDKSE